MTQPLDIFKQPVNIGDRVAVGMSYGQSSVLRVGTVLGIREKKDWEGSTVWSVRIKWTHNGRNSNKYDVKESSIRIEESHYYAKLMVLPSDFVEQYPSDNEGPTEDA